MSVFIGQDPTAVVGRRVLAYVIDAALGAILVAMLVGAVIQDVEPVPDPFSGAPTCPAAVTSDGTCFEIGSTFYEVSNVDLGKLVVIPLGASFANAVVLTGLLGASVGKFVVGIRVVNQRGQIAGVGRSFGRWVLFVVDGLCAGTVGFVVMLMSRGHRRIGDMGAGTYVVRGDALGYPPTLEAAWNLAVVPPRPPAWAPEPQSWVPPAGADGAPGPSGPPPPPRGPGSPPPWTPG